MFGQIGRLINRIALSDRNYRFLFEAEPGNEAVSLDCETTGFDPLGRRDCQRRGHPNRRAAH